MPVGLAFLPGLSSAWLPALQGAVARLHAPPPLLFVFAPLLQPACVWLRLLHARVCVWLELRAQVLFGRTTFSVLPRAAKQPCWFRPKDQRLWSIPSPPRTNDQSNAWR